MKPTVVSADVLFEAFRNRLHWQWVAGLGASERRFDEVAVRAARSGADLVGYLNYIHPYRVQILGEREIAYISGGDDADPQRSLSRIARIVTLQPPVIVLADGQSAPAALISMCEEAQIPMFATRDSSAFVIDVLRAYLSKHFADRVSMHGVFMDILGLGVLITGESGLGKSELGLELISRGNGLVADDAVDLYRINQATIEGRCPELLQNLLEVRGIGLLDIRAIFGETAVRRKMRLKLIVHLVRKETLERDYERMPHEPLTQDIIGIPVRKVVIQVVAGRNIAVLVEAAVRNTILQLRGIDTYQEFLERHREAMERGYRVEGRLGQGFLRQVAYRLRAWSAISKPSWRAMACWRFSISVSKNSSTWPQSRHTRWSWCCPSLSSYRVLPPSNWLRVSSPACSNWVSTR